MLFTPLQTVAPPETEPPTEGEFIVRFTPLSVPFKTGLSLITLILYPVPSAVLDGIVINMDWLPELFEATVCKSTGVTNEPFELDN